MNLHREVHFERAICDHLATNGSQHLVDYRHGVSLPDADHLAHLLHVPEPPLPGEAHKVPVRLRHLQPEVLGHVVLRDRAYVREAVEEIHPGLIRGGGHECVIPALILSGGGLYRPPLSLMPDCIEMHFAILTVKALLHLPRCLCRET